jgi:hypothetical protein
MRLVIAIVSIVIIVVLLHIGDPALPPCPKNGSKIVRCEP